MPFADVSGTHAISLEGSDPCVCVCAKGRFAEQNPVLSRRCWTIPTVTLLERPRNDWFSICFYQTRGTNSKYSDTPRLWFKFKELGLPNFESLVPFAQVPLCLFVFPSGSDGKTGAMGARARDLQDDTSLLARWDQGKRLVGARAACSEEVKESLPDPGRPDVCGGGAQ